MSKKNKKGIVYSTNPDFEYEYEDEEIEETLPPEKQKLRVELDRKKRKGKQVSLVTGFVGTEDDLKDLSKILKTKCGVGGSAKDGEIVIQGDHRKKIGDILTGLGYKCRVIWSQQISIKTRFIFDCIFQNLLRTNHLLCSITKPSFLT